MQMLFATGICFKSADHIPISISKFEDKMQNYAIAVKSCKGDHCEKNQTEVQRYLKEIAFNVLVFQEKINFERYINDSSETPTRVD